MAKVVYKSYNQNDNLLFPHCIGDFIPENDPVRVLDAIVEHLDISAIEATYKGGGLIGGLAGGASAFVGAYVGAGMADAGIGGFYAGAVTGGTAGATAGLINGLGMGTLETGNPL